MYRSLYKLISNLLYIVLISCFKENFREKYGKGVWKHVWNNSNFIVWTKGRIVSVLYSLSLAACNIFHFFPICHRTSGICPWEKLCTDQSSFRPVNIHFYPPWNQSVISAGIAFTQCTKQPVKRDIFNRNSRCFVCTQLYNCLFQITHNTHNYSHCALHFIAICRIHWYW